MFVLWPRTSVLVSCVCCTTWIRFLGEALVAKLNVVGYFISSILFSFEAQQQTQPDNPLAINPPQVKLSLGCLSGRPKMVSFNVKHTSSCITPSYITPLF
jgi:hypothetical protein